MKLNEKSLFHQSLLSIAVLFLVVGSSSVTSAEQAGSEANKEPVGLMGHWCFIKKRRVTQYTVKGETLHIRSGRSGRLYEADLSCDDNFTKCEAMTIRGWNTPVTEILELTGEKMTLTRIWGGSWKDKTYKFTYSRCPKF